MNQNYINMTMLWEYCILLFLYSYDVEGFTAQLPLTSQGSPTRHQLLVGLFESANDNDNGNDNDEPDEDLLFAAERRKLFDSVVPGIPTSSSSTPPSKSDVYNPDELAQLWEMHQQLTAASASPAANEATLRAPEEDLQDSMVPSLHELVLQTVAQVDDADAADVADKESTSDLDESLTIPALLDEWTQKNPELLNRASKISAIASDVDGTLIGSEMQQVHPRTQKAIQDAVQSVVSPIDNSLKWFFPATGKTRKGALDSLGPELKVLLQDCPGVFIQGLYCVYQGKVIFEQKLSPNAVVACEALIQETGTSVIAYDGDDLYTTKQTPLVRELNVKYGEPAAQTIGCLADHAQGMHKLLLMDSDVTKLNEVVRPQLEALAVTTNATVTQAIPEMLEFLPAGCSKALGVEKLCEVLGIDLGSELLALGDAENDVEMLQAASIGVAMGNASPVAKDSADIVLDETAAEGGAGLAMEVIRSASESGTPAFQ